MACSSCPTDLVQAEMGCSCTQLADQMAAAETEHTAAEQAVRFVISACSGKRIRSSALEVAAAEALDS